jgi:beta-glucosidase
MLTPQAYWLANSSAMVKALPVQGSRPHRGFARGWKSVPMKIPSIALASLLALSLAGPPAIAQTPWGSETSLPNAKQIFAEDPEVEELLAQMTWREKCGQLNQYAGALTGPQPLQPELRERIRSGEVGSVLSISGVERCRDLQKEALATRLGIPLVFAFDVIHGYRTIFPIPLAEAAAFDVEMAEQAARISATEAAAAGINWTFAPMVDIARDPRWGRVIEGAGEDPYLGSVLAAARVRGFQGSDLKATDTLAATAKHLGGYGAAEGGRDYDTSELSERTLRDVYFPPFEAAMKAGVMTVMPAFQEMAGYPCHASPFLLDQVLRDEWGFPGVVVSDYGAIEELINHRLSGDRNEVGRLALEAGVDIDMMSDIYRQIPQTPENEKAINTAVRRVLALKKALGLFEDPYRHLDVERERQTILKPEFRTAARRAAARGAVLMENRDKVLPLPNQKGKTVAVIGPLADDARSALGEWNLMGTAEETVSALAGLKKGFEAQGATVTYHQGCPSWDKDSSKIAEAAKAAAQADLVILILGEPYDVTGESRNRTEIGLPGSQWPLAEAVLASKKPVVTVLMNGRPLTIPELKAACPTILTLWHPGSEAGNALFDLLTGAEIPGGKLPMSWPEKVGQVPTYYNHKASGRPPVKGVDKYKLAYHDAPLAPLYPFGYGLSYSTFRVDKVKQTSASGTWPLELETTVTNTGTQAGDEVVQLYINDEARTLTPPVKELKGFQRVRLQPGASAKVSFKLRKEDLTFIGADMKRVFEPGWFGLATGPDSRVEPQIRLELK